MDDATRFNRARSSAAYKVAFLDELPASTFRVTSVIAMAGVMTPLVVVLAITRPFAAVIAGSVAVLAIAATIASIIADRRAPVVRQLAIVASTWSATRGSSREVQRIARTITLRDAYGIERDFRMSSAVVGDAMDGSIGLATIRRGRVIQFADLDT